jgi:arylsulfatase A-like enzyme
MRPLLRGLCSALLIASAALGGAWLVGRAGGGRPDTVTPAQLAELVAPDPDLPLSAAETDVLMLTICTLRKDRLGFHGGTNPTSPFLDRFTEHAVVFDRHFAQAPWTRPSMGALYTGKWPRPLGLDDPEDRDAFDTKVRPEDRLLGRRLKDEGYATVGVVANPNLKARFGFAAGFDAYWAPKGTYKKGVRTPASDRVVHEALERVRAVPADQRLYLRTVMLDGHDPERFHWHHIPFMRAGRMGIREYDAGLRRMDSQLGRLIAAIRAERPNLLVMLTADHGEGLMLPRRHGSAHGNQVVRSVVEVPWVVHHRSLAPRRVADLSMNIDVVPTVLDLLGLPPADDVHGASQARAIRGEAGAPVHDAVYSETFFRKSRERMVFDGRHQLVRTWPRSKRRRGRADDPPEPDRLYTAADWRWDEDIARLEPEVTARLGALLDAWQDEQAALTAAAGAAASVEVDADTRSALEAIGYVE